jgi:hypothetical protein
VREDEAEEEEDDESLTPSSYIITNPIHDCKLFESDCILVVGDRVSPSIIKYQINQSVFQNEKNNHKNIDSFSGELEYDEKE